MFDLTELKNGRYNIIYNTKEIQKIFHSSVYQQRREYNVCGWETVCKNEANSDSDDETRMNRAESRVVRKEALSKVKETFGPKNVAFRVFTMKTAPPSGCYVFQWTGTTFELNQHII
ncbi:hypothetical protein DPMN_110266 [Dreissena polymorpha]|uniref:Uncharacterized protein n=1 Tax=Dreissena polymorpha TaxID=45954 RepID=A0A9D4KCA3_DREPO|nr:hypothetical protein DPMN_110266 [Dreissena polymorpha]